MLTPENKVIPIVKKLAFWFTNNKAKYEACVMGMEALIALKVTEVVLGDSILVINQATNEWDMKEPHLKSYLEYLE